MVAPVYYSADMVRALPHDGNRYEVVHGELLVTPAPLPWHQEVVARLLEALRSYVRSAARGFHVFASPADLSWTAETLGQDAGRRFPCLPVTRRHFLDRRHARAA